MDRNQLFEIAKRVDNEYTPCRDSFTAVKVNNSYWSLTTNVCDMASLIRIYEKNNKISRIERLGPDTEGWEDIQLGTWGRIETYLNSLNNLI